MNCQHPINQAYYRRANKQGGVVLFMAIIALVILMLAAVALVRSVDTSTIIARNLAMKQSATISGDRGLWNGAAQISATQAGVPASIDPSVSTAHPFNVNSPATGYYSTVGTIDLLASTPWAGLPSVTDSSGNSVQYIVERLCNPGTILQNPSDCLYYAKPDYLPKIQPATNIGVPTKKSTPLFRITAKVTGAKNTLSYIQSIYY
jgi:Tfp pilus assembly protein PilX